MNVTTIATNLNGATENYSEMERGMRDTSGILSEKAKAKAATKAAAKPTAKPTATVKEENVPEFRRKDFLEANNEEKKRMIRDTIWDGVSNIKPLGETLYNATRKSDFSMEKLERIHGIVKTAISTSAVSTDKRFPLREIRHFNEAEKAQRRQLTEEYAQTITTNIVQAQRASNIALACLLDDDRRVITTYIRPRIGEQYDVSAERLLAFCNADTEKEAKYLTEVMQEHLNLYHAMISHPITDQEFVQKYIKQIPDLCAFSEAVNLIKRLNGSEPGIFNAIMKEGNESYKKIYEEFAAAAPAMVSMSGLVDKYAHIASPDYAEMDFDDISDVFACSQQLNYNTDSPAYEEQSKNIQSIPEIAGSTLSVGYKDIMGGAYSFGQDYCNSTSAYVGNKQNYIADITKSLAEGQTFQNLKGETIEPAQAAEMLLSGKTLDIYQEGELKTRLDGMSKFSSIPKEKVKTFNPVKDDVGSVMTAVKALYDRADAQTHWYMSSSKEYKDLRKGLKDLYQMDPDYDIHKYAEKMAQVSALASKYLAIKEEDGVKITDNTRSRIAAARYIADTLNASMGCFHEIVEERNLYDYQNEIDVDDITFEDQLGIDSSTELEAEPELPEEQVEEVPEKSIDEASLGSHR